MAYDPVIIYNSTGHNVPQGKVEYLSWVCKDDNYSIGIDQSFWQASSRGSCLVTKITATVDVRGKHVQAVAYDSSGTSYSRFAVVATGPESFAVTRLITGSDNVDLGEIQPEPTEEQK